MDTKSREPSRFPVRGTIAAAGTVGALALLLSFRGGPLHPSEPALGADAFDLAQATTDQAQAGATPTDALASATPADTPVAEDQSVASEPAAVDPTAEPSTEPTRTATGAPVSFRWGDVQVAVSVQGNDIVDVVTLSVPMGDRHSQRISTYVEPILREEAITYDTADVSVISGATYTSRAYAMSLQSALDQLGF